MSKRERLRREGKALASIRGHRLGRFIHDDRGAIAECRHCGLTLTVLPRPRPNEAELMGGALAVDCRAGDRMRRARLTVAGPVHLVSQCHRMGTNQPNGVFASACQTFAGRKRWEFVDGVATCDECLRRTRRG